MRQRGERVDVEREVLDDLFDHLIDARVALARVHPYSVRVARPEGVLGLRPCDSAVVRRSGVVDLVAIARERPREVLRLHDPDAHDLSFQRYAVGGNRLGRLLPPDDDGPPAAERGALGGLLRESIDGVRVATDLAPLPLEEHAEPVPL